MDSSGVVMYWSYDSFDDGKISSSICEDPRATFEFTGNHTDVFNCSE
jgi:hypothetical protein